MLNIDELRPLPAYSQQTLEQPAIKHYLDYYHLNFLEQRLCSEQAFGAMPLGNYQIALHTFCVENPKATVVFIHGYLDHVGSHSRLVDDFLKRSFNVIAFDLPGHGLSSGAPASISNFDEYQKVLTDLTAQVNQWDLPHPRYLVGHSTGGSIATQYVQNCSFPDYDKIVLLAPLIEPYGWRWIKVQLAVVKYFKTSIKRRFIQNTTDDEFWLFIHLKDPLQAQIVSIDWLLALKSWQENNFMSARPLDIPTLMIQGAKDKTVNGTKNKKLLAEKFNHFTFVSISGARHHLVGESKTFRQQINTALFDFLSLSHQYPPKQNPTDQR